MKLKVIYLTGLLTLLVALYCVTPFCPRYNPQIRKVTSRQKYQKLSDWHAQSSTANFSLSPTASMINGHSSSSPFDNLFSRFFFCIQWSMITVLVHPSITGRSPPDQASPLLNVTLTSSFVANLFSPKRFGQVWVFFAPKFKFLSSTIFSVRFGILGVLCWISTVCKYVACQLVNHFLLFL